VCSRSLCASHLKKTNQKPTTNQTQTQTKNKPRSPGGKEQVTDVLLDCIEQAFRDCYPNELGAPLTRADICILDSTNDNKVSNHMVGSSGRFLWKNAGCLATLVERVRALAYQRLLPNRVLADATREKLVDLSVYDANKKFRFWGCTKRGQQRWLELLPHPGCWIPRCFEDTVVCIATPTLAATVLPSVGSRFTLVIPGQGRDLLHEMETQHRLCWLRNTAAGDALVMYKPGAGEEASSLAAHAIGSALGWLLADGPFPVMEWTQQQQQQGEHRKQQQQRGKKRQQGQGQQRRQRVQPCADSDFEQCAAPLRDFLHPFRVPTGSAHNVRWTRLVSDALFMVPPDRLAELPAAMAAATLPGGGRAFMLHEAPKSAHTQQRWQKLAVDLDGIPDHVSLEHEVIPLMTRLIGLGDQLECHVTEAPPRPSAPGRRHLHLIFQCAVRFSSRSPMCDGVAACPVFSRCVARTWLACALLAHLFACLVCDFAVFPW
jgi:hypothetical protein